MGKRIESLDDSQLDAILQFSQALYSDYNYGIYNPFNQNENLLGISGKSTKFTRDELVKALESSPYDYKKLSEYSSFYETFDAIYSKTIKYLLSLLSFDLTYSCNNIKDVNEYNSKEYKEDLKRVYKFLDNFDYKNEFKKIFKSMLVRDVVYTWFRDSHEIESPIELDEIKIKKNEKFALQIMPQDYCMITGYFNNSQLLYDIDMNYFLNKNVDINLFAPQLKKMLRTAYNNDDSYKPSASLQNRNGSYANYVQCNPTDGAYAFKFDTSTFAQKPPFISLLKSCIDNDTIENLQKDKNMISAWFLLAGEIGLLNDTKTQKADNFAIKPSTMGKFMSLVNKGIKNNVKPILMPAQNIRGWKYDDQNPSMVKNQLQSSSGQGVSASSLIYTDGKMAQFELQNAIESDYGFVKQVYGQFAQFLNFFVNKKTKKYKFNFSLDGLDRSWWKKEKSEALRNLSDKGFTLPPQYWASILGMNVQDFVRGLEESHSMGLTENYCTLLMNANTMKDGSQEDVGRPTQDGLDKSDKTEEVQDYGN